MKKNILMKTNIFICVVIVFGFTITSIISYFSNRGIFEQDVERVSDLTSEGIYYQIDSILPSRLMYRLRWPMTVC